MLKTINWKWHLIWNSIIDCVMILIMKCTHWNVSWNGNIYTDGNNYLKGYMYFLRKTLCSTL